MIRGFRDFILRGNVIDLAVAVVIGVAFTAIVTALSVSIIQPLINALSPAASAGLGGQLVADKPNTYLDFAAVITAAINFLIIAAIVYFVFVLPLNKLKERRGEQPDATDVELLTEIRDLLRAQQTRD